MPKVLYRSCSSMFHSLCPGSDKIIIIISKRDRLVVRLCFERIVSQAANILISTLVAIDLRFSDPSRSDPSVMATLLTYECSSKIAIRCFLPLPDGDGLTEGDA